MILQNWWFTTLMGVKSPICAPLKGDIEADVLVIGGGACGLSAARRLVKGGAKIVLLEKNICGGSSTGKSAGFLTPDSELELAQLLRRFGSEGAHDLWQAGVAGVDIIRAAIKEYGINCDLQQQDSLYVSRSRGTWKEVIAEHHIRETFGYPTTLYPKDKLSETLGAENYTGGVRYPDTYVMNPLLYSQGVKRGLLEEGVIIHEATAVTAIEGHTAKTDMGSVTAKDIIFCADKMTPDLTEYAWNAFTAQTFLTVSEPLPDKMLARMFPKGALQCWDSDLIYSYYRLIGSNRLVLGGGSLWTTFSRKDVTTPAVIQGVLAKFRKHFPYLEKTEFIQYWPGRIDMTRDLLPTVTKDVKHSWIHHVLGCVGLPWASFCGDFVARHVLDTDRASDRRFYKYFSPKRGFLIPIWLEKLIGKRIVFALNTAWAKYYQDDKGKIGSAKEDDF